VGLIINFNDLVLPWRSRKPARTLGVEAAFVRARSHSRANN
jgi:hypothetical protein